MRLLPTPGAEPEKPLGVPKFLTQRDGRATNPLPADQRALEHAIMGNLPRVDLTHPTGTPKDGQLAAEALAMRFAKVLADVDAKFAEMEAMFLGLKKARDDFAKYVEDTGMELVELAQRQTTVMARASARIARLMEDDEKPAQTGKAVGEGGTSGAHEEPLPKVVTDRKDDFRGDLT
jgi:hypothetical protein